MADSNYHGMHASGGKSFFCTRKSFEQESMGNFGRMFRSLPPLYTNTNSLNKLGAKDGPMGGGNALKTDSVPLGMIFLGQFIDHDITFDTTSSFSSVNNPSDTQNARTARLDLDCVFGGGPDDEPFMYTRSFDAPRSPELRLFLLTGKTNNNPHQGLHGINDLPRNGRGRAIIGDPRNDENRVISQLQLAFIRFYNHIYNQITTEDPNLKVGQVYEKARRSATWHYQWMVMNEFLPALCGRNVVNDILGHGRQFYKPCNQVFIPVEFSIAAYRFGHSMIAESMRLRNGGSAKDVFSSDFGKGFSRVRDEAQIVEWTEFFDFKKQNNFQKAAQLNTKIAAALLNLPDPIVGKNASDADRSLASRNLRRGQSFLLPSGESVARFMGRTDIEIGNVTSFINGLINGTEIDLSSGTPLWFYILAEAETLGKNGNMPGEGLGPVGARIVAEVLIGLLELDEESFLGSNRNWLPSLSLPGQEGTFDMRTLLTFAENAKNIPDLPA